jgi:MFS transporter, Spinster family, sphingosine-1-phosphate transporter
LNTVNKAFGARGLLILGLLLLVNILNFVDRLLPSILVGGIRKDLGLTDAEIGLMAGVAFAVIYSFAGVAMGRVADLRSPRLVIWLSLAFWSLATALSGLAQSFWQLFAARAGVAAGEAGCTPAAHALIARVFPLNRRSLVVALFSLGVPIGGTMGLILGGWINDLFSWRAAFFVVGLPGLAVAGLVRLLVPDPPHQSPQHTSTESLGGTVRFLFAIRSFRHMAMASSLFAIGSYAMNVFAPAFLMRTYTLAPRQAGVLIGLANGLGGLVGTFAGGALGDWLGRKDPRWRQGVPAIGLALSAPTALAAYLVPDQTLSVILLTLVYFFGLLYFAPTFAAAQLLVPDSIRASTSSILLFCLTLIGASVGPYVIGKASDLLAPRFGALSLRYAMCLMAITMLWSAWHFLCAARALPADLRQNSSELAKA